SAAAELPDEFPDEFESTADEHAAPANESVGADMGWLDAADEPAVVPEHAIAVACAAWSGPDGDEDDSDDDGETNSSPQKRGSASTLVASDDQTWLRRYDDMRRAAYDQGKGTAVDEGLPEHISFEDAVAEGRRMDPKVLWGLSCSCEEEIMQLMYKRLDCSKQLGVVSPSSGEQGVNPAIAILGRMRELEHEIDAIKHEQLVYDSALGISGPEPCL
ncbi:hypothetical protein IWQ57_005212, partial [Coemansia nantahalensis]